VYGHGTGNVILILLPHIIQAIKLFEGMLEITISSYNAQNRDLIVNRVCRRRYYQD
jgi:hypothetical protein